MLRFALKVYVPHLLAPCTHMEYNIIETDPSLWETSVLIIKIYLITYQHNIYGYMWIIHKDESPGNSFSQPALSRRVNILVLFWSLFSYSTLVQPTLFRLTFSGGPLWVNMNWVDQQIKGNHHQRRSCLKHSEQMSNISSHWSLQWLINITNLLWNIVQIVIATTQWAVSGSFLLR